MNTYFTALFACRVHTKLNDNWLRPIMWLYKLKLKFLAEPFTHWMLECYTWHENSKDKMLSQSRLFLGYDGALGEHGLGRDSSEFVEYVVDRMGESMLFFQGRVAPRVEMEIALDDPERFPYYYVKWVTLLNLFKIRRYFSVHRTWISFSVLLILIQILTLLITLR